MPFITAQEYCETIFDGTHDSPKYLNVGYPLITSKHLSPSFLDISSAKRISQSDFEKINKRSQVSQWDILFSMIGTVGRVYLEQNNEIPYAVKNVGVFSCKDRKKALCLYYYLQSPLAKQYINSVASGAVQQFLSLKNLREFPVPRDLTTRYKGIEFLAKIDKKIKLNNLINDNLLQILGRLYQKRFNLSATTKNKGVLSDICCYSTEKVNTSKLNEETYFSTENMLVNKQGATEATNLPSITQVTACHSGDTLVSNIRPYFKKIVYCHCDCGCSADVLCFHPKQALYSQYLFCILYADTFFKFVEAGSKGTKMPRGDKQQIMNYPVKLVTEQELKEFNVIAKPILEQINNNNFENKKLAMLRDMLLSKLITASSRFS